MDKRVNWLAYSHVRNTPNSSSQFTVHHIVDHQSNGPPRRTSMATRPSLALDLFEQIKTHHGHVDAVSFLRAMINSTPPTFETEFLDFKGAQGIGSKSIPDDDVKK